MTETRLPFLRARLAGGILALNRFLMTLQNKRMPVVDVRIEGDAAWTEIAVSLDCCGEMAKRYALVLEALEDVEGIDVPEIGGTDPVSVQRLDHLVLTVADLERTVAFYERVLGMEGIAFGEGRRALRYGEGKINLHEVGKEIEPKGANPTPGSADLCFVVDGGIPPAIQHLRSNDVEILQGPVEREGALGPMTSVYLRDPDGNLIELSSYEGHGPKERGI